MATGCVHSEETAFLLARRLGWSWREVQELPAGALPFLLPLVDEPVRLPRRHRMLGVFWRLRYGR